MSKKVKSNKSHQTSRLDKLALQYKHWERRRHASGYQEASKLTRTPPAFFAKKSGGSYVYDFNEVQALIDNGRIERNTEAFKKLPIGRF